MQPGLHIVGTPIGNLQDITLRAIETLKTAHAILAEDTRITRRLLDRHGIATPMLSYHKFNEAARIDEILTRLRAGQTLALVTDAGMPAISDPGARVVAACHQNKLPVYVVPGPTALTSAIALSGMAAAGFTFGGFLPHKSGQRRKQLFKLATGDLPLALYESPYRLIKLMNEIDEVLGPRTVFIARELTKHFEETLTGTPAQIRDAYANRAIKGEIVVIIAPGDGAPTEPPNFGDDADAEEDTGQPENAD